MSIASDHRPVGRPPIERNAQVKEKLLEVTRRLFRNQDFDRISIRRISSLAEVSPAMVKYYFTNKQGLYFALVDEFFSNLQRNLSASNSSDTFTLADFNQAYFNLIVANPWWPNFVVREVLFSKGETRTAVSKKISDIFTKHLQSCVQDEIDSGRFRKDLDAGFTLMSLVGLTLFPFLVQPVAERVFHLRFDKETTSRLAEHNVRLFYNGVLAPNASVVT